MNKKAAGELQELIESPQYYPSVSILLPFEPKMSAKHELQQQLRSISNRVRQLLGAGHPPEMQQAIMNKLTTLVKELDYTTHKKSICIFVSPVAEKLLYLSIPVEEKIIVDQSFQIRDVVLNKKQQHKFLLLLLSGATARLYLNDNGKMARVVCDLPADIAAFENDAPERVSNFSDPAGRKEATLHKFLHHVDNSLSLILEAYPLPLFVAANDRVLGHFKMLSRHAGYAVATINGNFMDETEERLSEIVKPFVEDWQKTRQKDILIQLDKARSAGKLVTGMQEVWKTAQRSNNRLLVVEKSFSYPADKINEESVIAHTPQGQALHLNDAVDDVMENILVKGGDVEIVDDGMLGDYNRIALIRYYPQTGSYY